MKNNFAIPQPLPRIARFEKLGFGLFLHFGLYSLLGKGEWVQDFEKIPVQEYERLAERFTVEKFDARAMARLCRDAGMRYACLTTRHHDGFSLYDTRGLSAFDAPHSAAGRDLVAEFVEGCRAEGIVPFLYHTTLDWRWDSKHCSEERFAEYLDYLNASVEILCTQYGEIGGLWFDGNWSRPGADWKEDRLYATIRKHQPEAIIVNNTGLDARGALGHPELDSLTFEQGLPAAPDRSGWPKYLAGESCETLNAHWGVGARDFLFKSPPTVIERLCACRKVGANYLLNVGPQADGSLGAYEVELLKIVGRWIHEVGGSIYAGKPVPAQCGGRDFLLEAEGRLYYFAHALNVQGDKHVVPGGGNGPRSISGLNRKLTGARWLDNDAKIPFIENHDGSVTVLDCHGYDYGTNLVVRIAELSVAV